MVPQDCRRQRWEFHMVFYRPSSFPSTPPPFPFESAGSSSRPPTYAPMPGTPQKRRYDPRGLLLGTWKHAGLDAVRANAVYGSRDKQDRINRRISKESPTGQLASGGHVNNEKTACSHEDIDYLPPYQGHRFLLTGGFRMCERSPGGSNL